MLGVALRSLRHRPGSLAATFVAALLGAVMVMAFASMLDTGAGPGVDAASRETLTTMAVVVGAWGLLIAVFALTSTYGLHVRGRARELAVLRAAGATPAQIGRMLVLEAVAVAALATLLALGPAALGGSVLLGVLEDTNQVAAGVGYRFGPIAILTGLGVTTVAAVAAALLSSRRARRLAAAGALTDAAVGEARLSRKRVGAGVAFLVLGLDLAVVTATVFKGEGIDAMQTGGQASIWFAIGLAILAPAIVRRVTAAVAGALDRRDGVVGHLAVLNLRGQSGAMARTLMPVILFVGIATGTLYLQGIERSVPFASGGGITRAEADNIQTLNLVVVGMIALFAAIMVVNTVVAATVGRRQEFARGRLAGLTPPQVRRIVALESTLLALTGIAAGSLAALVTVIPYSIARTGSVLPDVGLAMYGAVVGVAVLLTVAAGLGATRTALRGPAVHAAAQG